MSFGADFENAFGAANFAFFPDDAIVLRAEALTELLSPVPSRQKKTDHGDNYDRRDYADYDCNLLLVHAVLRIAS